MNARLLITLGICAASPLACNCAQVPIEIPSETTVTIPGTGIDVGNNPLVPDDVFPTDVIEDLLASELSESLDTSGYDKGAVVSLKLTSMRLSALWEDNGGPEEGLECFESLTMFVGAAEDDNVKVAFSEEGAFDGDPGPATYDMKLTDEELNDYFQKSDALVVTADVTPGERPLTDLDVKLEFEITGWKGSRRWLETHAVPLRDKSGNVESLLGITRDVTERRLAAMELQRSASRYRQLFDSLGCRRGVPNRQSWVWRV